MNHPYHESMGYTFFSELVQGHHGSDFTSVTAQSKGSHFVDIRILENGLRFACDLLREQLLSGIVF